VRWIHGDATTLPPLQVDLVTMTGNVAQVFVTDAEWASTLRCARAALCRGGHLAFETRDPQQEAWRAWNRERTQARTDLPGAGVVESWAEVTDVSGNLVSFRWTFVFAPDGAVLTSDSTLRFRSRDEITDSLLTAGFTVDEVRDAPDRPGRELVFVASRVGASATRLGISGRRPGGAAMTNGRCRERDHVYAGRDGQDSEGGRNAGGGVGDAEADPDRCHREAGGDPQGGVRAGGNALGGGGRRGEQPEDEEGTDGLGRLARGDSDEDEEAGAEKPDRKPACRGNG